MARTLFDYEENRLDYGRLLMPEPSFNVDFAVGFTYSLDLEALLGVPISLGLLDEDMDSSLMDNPLFLLEALRRSSDKLAIFCNTGCILLPQQVRSVFALLENSVFEVSLNSMKNFHPKMWFIKYSNPPGESYIKLIVLSRNLTFDQSFDYAVEMIGVPGRRRNEKNRPLAEFLEFSAQYAEPRKKKEILAMAEDVHRIAKFSLDERFEDYTFFPMGIKDISAKNTGLMDACQSLIVVSPFLSASTITKMAKSASSRKTLITRKRSLNKQILSAFSDVYIVKDFMLDNEVAVDAQPHNQSSDIHAKLYFTSGSQGNHLYIGSANASNQAFYHNVEFLLKLKFKPYMTSYNAMLKELLPQESCPFEVVQMLDEDGPVEDSSDILDRYFKEALLSVKGAKVSPTGNTYSITIQTNGKRLEKEVWISPLPVSDKKTNKKAILENGAVFENLLLKELSEFFVLQIEDRSIVTKIPITNMPDGRDQAIYNSIIKDKAGFLNYVAMLLSDDVAQSVIDQPQIRETIQGPATNQTMIPAAFYEKMLQSTVNKPKRLLELEDLMDKLDESIVSDFRVMYQHFKTVAKRMME